MYCPICKKKDTKVLDSRVAADGYAVRRRRECSSCNFRFSTYEEIELLNIMVIKTDGKKESYNRDKLEAGISRALEKRSYTQDAFRKLINKIERDIQKKRKDDVSSSEIGKIVIKHLKKFDKVAYIRFASVYHSFDDLQSFENELKTLIPVKKKK